MKQQRIQNLIHRMQEKNIDQMIVSSPSSLFYLTGEKINPKERLYVLFVDKSGQTVLVTNTLFSEVASLDVEKLWYSDSQDPVAMLSTLIREGATVAVDKVWHAHFLLELMQCKHANYVVDHMLVDYIRMFKDEEEKELMRETCRVNQTVIHELSTMVRPGVTERELAEELHGLYNKYGADGYNITPVVSFGPMGAEPHHRPDGTVLREGDSIIIDTGAFKQGYRSDMTRTFFYHHVEDEARKIYEIVRKAQLTALESIHIGMKFSDLDKIARDIITAEGYGEQFIHRLGHGIGVDGHEFPYVESKSDLTVQENMVFSIEPGIYVPGYCGVRIEDLVIATKDGAENLYDLTKELIILQ